MRFQYGREHGEQYILGYWNTKYCHSYPSVAYYPIPPRQREAICIVYTNTPRYAIANAHWSDAIPAPTNTFFNIILKTYSIVQDVVKKWDKLKIISTLWGKPLIHDDF